MQGIEIAFEQPWYLLGLLLIPCLCLLSFRSIAGLGPYRGLLALLLRNLILALLILAVADLQLLRRNDRLTVTYVLDQSASIPATQRDQMAAYVIEDARKHRDDRRRDRASVIVFGREAAIEVPPLDGDLPMVRRLETVANLRTDATNLEAALKLAQATFPEDSAHRVVIISDGNENLGNARSVARQMIDDGIGIDVVPVWLHRDRDIAVERLTVPADVRRGQPFEGRVVLNNLTPATTNGAGTVKGTVRIYRKQGADEQVLQEVDVELAPGKTVYSFADEIGEPDFYEYAAEFMASDPAANSVSQNDRAQSLTQVRGQGRVLIIEDWQHRDREGGPGDCRFLAERLRAIGLNVTQQFSDELFSSLAELQRYDAVILANVARSSGTDADDLRSFSDEQIAMLVRNTQQLGCGLVMLGGPESFGPGGWSGTELERAMPVDFRIKNAKVKAIGALAMVMHASEIPEGNYWQKVIGREALKALGPQDFAAVIKWDNLQGREAWLWGGRTGFLPVGGNARLMVARLDRMEPGDMPDFEPSLKMAAAAFASLPRVGVRHMICISDGDPNPPRAATLAQLKKIGAKVTTVAVGAHGAAGHATLQRIANATGGKYYVVRSPQALPRIYQQEARRVARPLIVERSLQPQLVLQHEIMRGIEALPPLQGFVMTTVKQNPLVEVLLISPYPSTVENATLLATWTYGLGRTAVFTSDAGSRWTNTWTQWEQYDKLFGQLVRWSMRPTGEAENFSLATRLRDGKTEVILDAFNKNEEFLNFLDVWATVVGPQLNAVPLKFRQSAPGRYVAEIDTPNQGNYFLTVIPGAGQPALRAGLSVPYAAEFRDRQTNRELLKSLASGVPRGGAPGRFAEQSLAEEDPAARNAFRRDLPQSVTANFVWPWLLLSAGCLFVGDVFVRRVAVNLAWVYPWFDAMRLRLRGQERSPEAALARLKSRKAQVASELEQRQVGVHYELELDTAVDTSVLEGLPPASQADRPTPEASRPDTAAPTEDTYTARLLQAKKDARQGQPRDDTD
jgi:uncharacterized membrane protein